MTEQRSPHIWGGTVDNGKFTSLVMPTDNPRLGQLTVVLNETGETLLDKEVNLAFGAIFGPDVADVEAWINDSVEVIDAWYVKNGLTPPEG
jgi:hypothetical protein